ncbi:MAG: recombinase family protein [Candidatus Moraniibacteriota bacterium]|nr:MAG: recombinase family protein [Candidatus Moranbacteria bacterium]
MGRFMEGVLSATAEFDNSVRSIRTTQGMKERLKNGIWVWQAPLGYHRPYRGSNLFPEPNIAPLIKLGFEEYSKGTYTYEKLALFLSERGLRSRAGKAITPQLMEKIIKNPLYCGVIKTWGESEGAFEPIISKELFFKCQPEGIRSAQPNPRSLNNPLFPLRRFIQCSNCETPLTGSTSKGRDGKGYPYYHHHHKGCEEAKSVPKEAFEQLFIQFLDDISPDAKYEKLFKAIVLDIWKNNYKRIDEENAKINRAVTALEKDRQKIFDLHRSGKYSDEDFDEQRKLISVKINQKRLLLREKWDEEFEMEKVLDYCFIYVRNSAEAWKKARYERRIRLQKLVFAGRIDYDGKKLGTTELRQIYRINQAYQSDKSSLVAPRGIEPLLPG